MRIRACGSLLTRSRATFLRVGLKTLPALLVAGFLALPAVAGGAPIHWGFETAADIGPGAWQQVGDPGQAGPGFATRSPVDAVRLNLEGQGFLTTVETGTPGTESAGLRGVWESPGFRLGFPYASLLLRGFTAGPPDPAGAFLALCSRDAGQPRGCRELTRVNAPGSGRAFSWRTLDLSGQMGKRVFWQLVDTSASRGIAIDDLQVNSPLMPQNLVANPDRRGPVLGWTTAPDAGRVAALTIRRAPGPDGPWRQVARLACSGGTCPDSYRDRSAPVRASRHYRLTAVGRDGSHSESNTAYAGPWAPFDAAGPRVWRQGARLSAVAMPVGGNGSSGILHLGDGRRNESLIFNTYGEAHDRDQYMVPGTFFALRTKRRGSGPDIHALQRPAEGPFPGVGRVSFNGEYPYGTWRFGAPSMPLRVSETVFSPTIPGNMKDSAIPTAIYDFRLANPGRRPVDATLLATQQNAVGLDGESEVGGVGRRQHPGYGSNHNRIVRLPGRTRLELTGDNGSMALTIPGAGVNGTASWDTETELHEDLRNGLPPSGPDEASSPGAGVTVDGALARRVTVPPGESRTVRVVLSWNFPERNRIFGGNGLQYTNWWGDANAVDEYVAANGTRLADQTRRFHDFVYGSNLPRFVLDRLTGNIAILRSPSMFWAKNGFFGGWEGWSCCWNMPTHVWQYAQTQARLWPEIGRKFESQWLAGLKPDGLLPYRYGVNEYAVDGQLGVILSAYRDHLLSADRGWLDTWWPQTAKAMEYVVARTDPDQDGVPGGQALTTLDFVQTVDNPWIGSLYLAALAASQRMATLAGDTARAATFGELLDRGRTAQADRYWKHGYFTGVPDPNPNLYSQANGLDIDMLLGQWWNDQLGLGPVYPPARMKQALGRLYRDNFHPVLTGANPHDSYPIDTWTPNLGSRVFAEATDGGMVATTWPDGGDPKAKPFYWREIWSGREYAAAAEMIRQGLPGKGLAMVKAVDDRYDGRLRNGPLMAVGPPGNWLETCHTGEGTGNPFGDDECGNWYGRALSSWSLLTALQGFSYDGPAGEIGFAPRYRPDSHRSFFTAGDAWGRFYQARHGNRFTASLRVAHGRLSLGRLDLGRVGRGVRGSVRVRLHGQPVPGARARIRSGGITVSFPSRVTVRSGTELTVTRG